MSARPGRRGPGSQSVDGDLCGLVDTDSVNVERGDSQARESRELGHDGGVPFAQTILHGGELGELTLPIRMDTESFHITVLIKVGLETAIGLDGDDCASVEPKLWQGTRFIARVVDLKMGEEVSTGVKRRAEHDESTDREVLVLVKAPWHEIGMLPDGFVFVKIERSGRVEVAGERASDVRERASDGLFLPREANQIGHGTDCKVRHNVHSAGVDLRDHCVVVVDCAIMGIENGEVEWRVTWSGLSEQKKGERRRAHGLSACHNMFKKGVPEMNMPLTPMPYR